MKILDVRLTQGVGISNKLIGSYKGKIVEVGELVDFDLLMKVLFNKRTVQEKDFEKKSRKKIEVKPVVQKNDYDCGGAAVSTLLLMLQREDVLKTDVYSRLGVNPVDGTKSIKIKELFNEEGISYLEILRGSLVDIENIIAAGGVCIMSYQAWGEPEEIERLECGHYSIIFDIDEEFVWLIDPSWEGEYVSGLGLGVIKRPKEEFDKLWIDKGIDGTIYEKWLLAVRI